MKIAYTAAKIFTGQQWLYNHAILTENGKVTGLVTADTLPTDMRQINFGQHAIVPAFIDLQIYGAGQKLFAVYPGPEALTRLREYCFTGGAHYCLPTVATNTYEVVYKCIDAIKLYWQGGGKGILGLHVEGPWINEVKRGAHIKELIHAPTLQQVNALLAYGRGVIKMITLAPEVCAKDVIELIKSQGIVVSAGHSNATFKQATTAFNECVPAATHLFNAMSPLLHRQPGMVGAVMHHPLVMSSIVPDGYHVDFEVISIAKKIMGDRLFMITDAVTETVVGPYQHQLQGDKYEANGILSGSALTLLKAVKNCVHKIGIGLDEALRMASLLPAKVIGLQNEVGKIEPGFATEWLVLDDDLSIVDHVMAVSPNPKGS